MHAGPAEAADLLSFAGRLYPPPLWCQPGGGLGRGAILNMHSALASPPRLGGASLPAGVCRTGIGQRADSAHLS